MDKLAYTAVNAMKSLMNRQTAIAHNMANSDTVGFKADMVSAEARYLNGPGHNSRAMSVEREMQADMNGGAVTQTDRPLDVAFEGDAMLAVQAADGKEAYTRRGDLQIGPSGGDPTQPQQLGKLKLVSTTGSAISKGADSLFHVADDGTLPVDDNARVMSGALEQSNVNMTGALVDMIETSRAWETQARLLKMTEDLDSGGASVMNLPQG